MRFRPKYTVLYRGEFYYPDEEFDIDPEDAEEMSRHGEVVDEPAPSIEEPEEKPKRGRRKKNDEPREDASTDE